MNIYLRTSLIGCVLLLTACTHGRCDSSVPSKDLRAHFASAKSICLRLSQDASKKEVKESYRQLLSRVFATMGYRVLDEKSKEADVTIALEYRAKPKLKIATTLKGMPLFADLYNVEVKGKITLVAPKTDECIDKFKYDLPCDIRIDNWVEWSDEPAMEAARQHAWQEFWSKGCCGEILLRDVIRAAGAEKCLGLLQDKSAAVRGAVARSMAQVGDASVAPQIREALSVEHNSAVKEYMRQAIEQLGGTI